MADNRIALLTQTANIPEAVQRFERGELAKQLAQAQVDAVPATQAAATQKLELDRQAALRDQQNQEIKIKEFVDSQTDAAREEGLRTAQQFMQIQTPEDFEAFKRINPVDSKDLANVQFGTPEFDAVRQRSGILVRAAQKPQQPDRTLVEVADPTSPTGTRFVPRAEAAGLPGKPASGTSLTVGPDGEVVLSQGRGVTQDGSIAPDRKVARDLQKDLISLTDNQQQLSRVAESFNPDFLTFQGKLAGTFSSLKAKANIDLTGDEKQFLRGKVQFENRVEQFFNRYRKEITGAAASVQELDRLKKSMLNVDQDPVSFKASMDLAISEVQRALRLKRKFLRDGISISDDPDAFDNAFLGQQDDDANVRGAELQADGLDTDQILNQLKSEGYTSV